MQKSTRLIKIIVFGATGRTGKLVCKRILNSGVIVTGFGRSAEKIKTIDKKLRTFQGDIFDKNKVSQAVSNHDAVIVCLGSINQVSQIVAPKTIIFINLVDFCIVRFKNNIEF